MLNKTYSLTETSINCLDDMAEETGYTKSELVDIAIMSLYASGSVPKKDTTLNKLYAILEAAGNTLDDFCESIGVTKEHVRAYCRAVDSNRRIWGNGTSRSQRSRDKESGRLFNTRTQYIDEQIKARFGNTLDKQD